MHCVKTSYTSLFVSCRGPFDSKLTLSASYLRSTEVITMVPELLTGEEPVVYGDSWYLGAEKREDATVHNNQETRIRYKINRRPSQSKYAFARSRAQIKRREREKCSVRSKVEYVFTVVKNQLQCRKTRYRSLRKQIAKLNIMFALANLILADRPCLAA